MSFSNTAETAILALIFTATTWSNIAINATSSPDTTIECALHTSDPADAGTMSTNEISYTSYARKSTNRNSGAWTVSGNSVSPAANLDFATATGGSATATHGSVGRPGGGAAAIHMKGAVTPNIAVSTGVTPRWTTASALTLD
jgi:hypothetical protein